MTQIIKVCAAAVSANGATFYTDTGDQVVIAATDPRVADMIDKVYLAIKEKRIPVEVDISTYTVFDTIQEKSGGFMKFFRVAKKGLDKLLGKAADRDQSVNSNGHVTTPKTGSDGSVLVQNQPGTPPVNEAINKALLKAHIEATKLNLSDSQTTVVAVVGNTPIVGAEKLTKQAQSAVSQGNTKSFENMLKRLALVAAERKHTAQEAMSFLEKMDLPPTLDGHILAYKSLTKTPTEGVFKDNHSGKLLQGLGTMVMMDVELVDDNRRVLCSNGLHVAQKGYLHGYGVSGNNVVTLIKIKPEDVIAVPLNENQKMRVRAYHIVAVLSQEDLDSFRNQRSITEKSDNASLLAKIINGDHVPVLNVTHQRADKTIYQMISLADAHESAKNISPEYDTSGVKPTEVSTLPEDGAEPPEEKMIVDISKINENIVKDGLDTIAIKAKRPTKADVKKRRQIAKNAKLKGKKPVTKSVFNNPPPIASHDAPKVPRTPGAPNKVRQAFDIWNQNKNLDTLAVVIIAKKKSKKGWDHHGLTPVEISQITDAIEHTKK